MGTKLALVTGGNGFVGCHVVRALLDRGDRVRVLARENADLSALAGLPVEIVRGDLRNFDSVARAVDGCNEVYHVAADYRLWLTDPEPMYATNVNGTENIIRAAVNAGVSRIVYTSTIGALDFKPTPTGRIIVDFLNRRMPAYVETGLNIVDVEDVARGHLLAAKRGRIGEKYIPGRHNLTLKEFLGRLAAVAGLPPPKMRIPYAVAFGYALGAEAFARTVT